MRPPRSWFDSLPDQRLLAEMSLWSADLMNMGADLARLDPYTDILHVDVADGHFSPAMLLFPDQVAAARQLTKKPIHVHLMVQDAILLAQIDQFIEAGADLNVKDKLGMSACGYAKLFKMQEIVDKCEEMESSKNGEGDG